MSPDGVDDELLRALASLDETTADALREAVRGDPDVVREMLVEYGYLDDADAVVRNEERDELTDAQRDIRDALETMGNPRSTDEVVELLSEDHPGLVDRYQSAEHRSWMNKQLNRLVETGELGRFRDGRTVRYTPDVSEAIRHWALQNSVFIEDIERSDAGRIADDTGMPRRYVQRALRELVGDES